jgi:hypothetical protein
MGNCKLSTSAALSTPKKPLVDSTNPVNDDTNIDAENFKSVAINSSMNENGNNDSTYTCNTSQEAVKETINCLLNTYFLCPTFLDLSGLLIVKSKVIILPSGISQVVNVLSGFSV